MQFLLNENLVEKLDYNFPFNDFKNLLFDFINLYKTDFEDSPRSKTQGQLSIQHSRLVTHDYHLDGVGVTKNYENYNLTNYCIINNFFKNTIVEKIINDFKLYRCRVLKLNPKSCYTVHKDLEKRLHIPIITNDKCYIIFPDKEKIYHLDQGSVYITDTTNNHTATNCSFEDRIHFVGCFQN